MKPKPTPSSAQEELFRTRLENLLDSRHELVKLAAQIDWSRVDEAFGELYAEKGRTALRTRLLVGLHYLKHAYQWSDEAVVERWLENPYHQFFCGEQYFQHRRALNPSSMSRIGSLLKAIAGELPVRFAGVNPFTRPLGCTQRRVPAFHLT